MADQILGPVQEIPFLLVDPELDMEPARPRWPYSARMCLLLLFGYGKGVILTRGDNRLPRGRGNAICGTGSGGRIRYRRGRRDGNRRGERGKDSIGQRRDGGNHRKHVLCWK